MLRLDNHSKGGYVMPDKKEVTIKLTEEQRKQVKAATGKDIAELKVGTVDDRANPFSVGADQTERANPLAIGADQTERANPFSIGSDQTERANPMAIASEDTN
jgi:hypothetical protein